MKLKKYLLYFLILIVAGAIAVSIFFAIKDRDDRKVPDEQSETAEGAEASNTQDEEMIIAEIVEEEVVEEVTEIFKDHYTSSSSEFPAYTFKCPDGWVLTEENEGQIVMLNNKTDKDSIESIMIIVEEAESFENGTEGLIEKYLLVPQSEIVSGEIEEIPDIEINGSKTALTGYYYRSGLSLAEDSADNTDGPGEVDLITNISDGGYVYIIKYMSSGIGKEPAIETFKVFLESLTIGGEIAGVREADESHSVNILILGVDSGLGRDWGRRSARSDINMILHINLETYGATIITIPRDLWVPIPGHDDGKINGAHAIGGPELAMETFEAFSGLDIDNYIITDFDGFIPLIDSLGGVTIEVNEDLADGFSNCYLSKGVHHLNGEQALALCRNRHRSGDGSTQGGAWAREREAAKVIKALYEQKTTLEKILALPAFVNFLLRYTWTDMDFEDVVTLLPVLGNIGTPEIELRGVPSFSKMIGKASAVVHYEDETRQMFEEIENQ